MSDEKAKKSPSEIRKLKKEYLQHIENCLQLATKRADYLMNNGKKMVNFNIHHHTKQQIKQDLLSMEIEFLTTVNTDPNGSNDRGTEKTIVFDELTKYISVSLFNLYIDGTTTGEYRNVLELVFSIKDSNGHRRNLVDTLTLYIIASRVLKRTNCVAKACCGGHIHVNLDNLCAEDIKKLLFVFRKKYNRKNNITGRGANRYCHTVPESYIDDVIKTNKEKYNDYKKQIADILKEKDTLLQNNNAKSFYDKWKTDREKRINECQEKITNLEKTKYALKQVLCKGDFTKYSYQFIKACDNLSTWSSLYDFIHDCHFIKFNKQQDVCNVKALMEYRDICQEIREYKSDFKSLLNKKLHPDYRYERGIIKDKISDLDYNLKEIVSNIKQTKHNKIFVKDVSRYKTINMQKYYKYNTVELRLFSGTIDMQTIYNRFQNILLNKYMALNA